MTATLLAAEELSAASQTNSKNRLVNKITAQPSPACKQTRFHAEARAGQVLERLWKQRKCVFVVHPAGFMSSSLLVF